MPSGCNVDLGEKSWKPSAHTSIAANVSSLEDGMRELTVQLETLNAQAQALSKEGSQVSPGLKQAIQNVKGKQHAVLVSVSRSGEDSPERIRPTRGSRGSGRRSSALEPRTADVNGLLLEGLLPAI